MESLDLTVQLDEEYEIMCRRGLHCASCAHKTIGTVVRDTVCFSPRLSTTHEDVARALGAGKWVARSGEH